MKSMKTIKSSILVFAISFFFVFLASSQDALPAPKQSMGYHGMRISNENVEFALVSAEMTRIGDGKVQIDFMFNQGVDPRSVNGKSVKLDGKVLPMEDTKFLFSKDGKTMRLSMSVTEGNFSVTLENIVSFSGVSLKKVEIQF
jgi:hypothetical protein